MKQERTVLSASARTALAARSIEDIKLLASDLEVSVCGNSHTSVGHQKHSFLYRNGLSLTLLGVFILLLAAQIISGWKVYKAEIGEKTGVPVTLAEYLSTAHFVEATFENFESEFLQMGMYVLLTIVLRQKGSSESKSLDEKEEVDREPLPHPGAPWPVKKGGIWLRLYKNSLSLAFLFLFLGCFIIHAYSSHLHYNKEQVLGGKVPASFPDYLGNPRLWFESFQNWQSEFIAVFSIVTLSIFLRQKGSPESKPVDAPHSETGE